MATSDAVTKSTPGFSVHGRAEGVTAKKCMRKRNAGSCHTLQGHDHISVILASTSLLPCFFLSLQTFSTISFPITSVLLPLPYTSTSPPLLVSVPYVPYIISISTPTLDYFVIPYIFIGRQSDSRRVSLFGERMLLSPCPILLLCPSLFANALTIASADVVHPSGSLFPWFRLCFCSSIFLPRALFPSLCANELPGAIYIPFGLGAFSCDSRLHVTQYTIHMYSSHCIPGIPDYIYYSHCIHGIPASPLFSPYALLATDSTLISLLSSSPSHYSLPHLQLLIPHPTSPVKFTAPLSHQPRPSLCPLDHTRLGLYTFISVPVLSIPIRYRSLCLSCLLPATRHTHCTHHHVDQAPLSKVRPTGKR